MSGKPYPEGVAKVIELLDVIETLGAEMESLRRSAKRLEVVIDQRTTLIAEYGQLMRNMDVDSSGNYGFAGRAGWFLSEMRRQLAAKAVTP